MTLKVLKTWKLPETVIAAEISLQTVLAEAQLVLASPNLLFQVIILFPVSDNIGSEEYT